MRKYRDFTLKNSNGKDVTISEELKRNKVLLLFYRGTFWGAWVNQMMQVRHVYSEILETGTKIYGVSVDNEEKTKVMIDKTGVKFDLSSDESLKVIDMYNFRDDELMNWDYLNGLVRKSKESRPISLSGYVLINQDGFIQYEWSGHYNLRPLPENVLNILSKVK